MRSWRCARGVGVAESDRRHARCVREKGHVCALEVDAWARALTAATGGVHARVCRAGNVRRVLNARSDARNRGVSAHGVIGESTLTNSRFFSSNAAGANASGAFHAASQRMFTGTGATGVISPTLRRPTAMVGTTRRDAGATTTATAAAGSRDAGHGAERAFHSVHDLVHYAILSQPNHTASLRCIYSICQRAGRIASKHGAGSRLITANEHWKSQIRHALYTSSRFKRIANDDWTVGSGHLDMPETTTVYLTKDEREAAGDAATTTHVAARAATHKSASSPPPSKRRRASTPSTPPPVSPRSSKLVSRASDDDVAMLKPRAVRLNSENSALSALTQDGVLFAPPSRGRSSVKEDSFRAVDAHHNTNATTKQQQDTSMAGMQSPSPERRQVSRSRSQSPEPRASSTLVVVAGLLEQELKCGKVMPRDTRRNRRKPAHGGCHAALPNDDMDVFSADKLVPQQQSVSFF